MAKNFTFHCQQKHTIWYDSTFTIKAESKEDAIKFLKEHSTFNSDELECQFPEKVTNIEGEYIYPEAMEAYENGGQPTIEYTENPWDSAAICTNIKPQIKKRNEHTCNGCKDKNYCSQSEYVKNNCYKLNK